MAPKSYQLYCDGAVSGSQAPTGVGVVILDENDVVLRQESYPAGIGTNQSAEILAAVAGLRLIPDGARVTVFSDSMYVIKTMTGQFARNANLQHWPTLDAEVRRMGAVEWKHCRGHNGNVHQEAADALAVLAKLKGPESKLPLSPSDPRPQPAAAPGPTPKTIEGVLQTAITTIANLALPSSADPNLRVAVTTAQRANAEAALLRRQAQDAGR